MEGSVILIGTCRQCLIILYISDQCFPVDDPKKEVEIHLGASVGPCSGGKMLVLVDKLFRKPEGRSPGLSRLLTGLSKHEWKLFV